MKFYCLLGIFVISLPIRVVITYMRFEIIFVRYPTEWNEPRLDWMGENLDRNWVLFSKILDRMIVTLALEHNWRKLIQEYFCWGILLETRTLCWKLPRSRCKRVEAVRYYQIEISELVFSASHYGAKFSFEHIDFELALDWVDTALYPNYETVYCESFWSEPSVNAVWQVAVQ